MPAKGERRTRWIVIPKWDQFQHYKDRNPPWIKNHLELLHDDAYLGLSLHLRGVLHGIWLAYAASHGQLDVTASPRRRHLVVGASSLSRHLGATASSRDLEALYQAGFIRFRASKPLALRARARDALARDEVLRTSSKKPLARTRSSGSRTRPSDNGPPPACPECGVGAGQHAADCSQAAERPASAQETGRSRR